MMTVSIGTGFNLWRNGMVNWAKNQVAQKIGNLNKLIKIYLYPDYFFMLC